MIILDTTDSFYNLTGLTPSLHGSLWESIEYFCCFLCFIIPRMRGPSIPARLYRYAEIGFESLSALAYCDAMRVARPMALYIAVFALLSLAIFFFAISQFPRRRRERSTTLRHYHRFLDILGDSIAGSLAGIFHRGFLWLDIALAWRRYTPRHVGPAHLPSRDEPRHSMFFRFGNIRASYVIKACRPRPWIPGFLDSHKVSKRAAEILPLFLQCLTYKEIGERLFITPGTVRTHVVHIYQKTGVAGRLELARLLAEGKIGNSAINN
jgi:DNA-binding CsgD family transcriptional regulator